jgi:hypothetical protein
VLVDQREITEGTVIELVNGDIPGKVGETAVKSGGAVYAGARFFPPPPPPSFG